MEVTKPRIFISYRSTDLALAKLVKMELERHIGKSRVYIDETIYGGDHIDSKLAAELLNSTVFLPLATEAYWGKLPRKEGDIKYRIEKDDDYLKREMSWAVNPKTALKVATQPTDQETRSKILSTNVEFSVFRKPTWNQKNIGTKKPMVFLPMKLSKDDRPDASEFLDPIKKYIDKLNELRFVDIVLDEKQIIPHTQIKAIKQNILSTYMEQGIPGKIMAALFGIERATIRAYYTFRKFNMAVMPCIASLLIFSTYIGYSNHTILERSKAQLENSSDSVESITRNMSDIVASISSFSDTDFEYSPTEPLSQNIKIMTQSNAQPRVENSPDDLYASFHEYENWETEADTEKKLKTGLEYAQKFSTVLAKCQPTSKCELGKSAEILNSEYFALLDTLSKITQDPSFETVSANCEIASFYEGTNKVDQIRAYLNAGKLYKRFYRLSQGNDSPSKANCNSLYLNYLVLANKYLNADNLGQMALEPDEEKLISMILHDSEIDNFVRLALETVGIYHAHGEQFSKHAINVFISAYDKIPILSTDPKDKPYRLAAQSKMLARWKPRSEDTGFTQSYVEQMRINLRKAKNKLVTSDMDSSIQIYKNILEKMDEIL